MTFGREFVVVRRTLPSWSINFSVRNAGRLRTWERMKNILYRSIEGQTPYGMPEVLQSYNEFKLALNERTKKVLFKQAQRPTSEHSAPHMDTN